MKTSHIIFFSIWGFLIGAAVVYLLMNDPVPTTYVSDKKATTTITTTPKTVNYRGVESIVTSVGPNGVVYVDTPSEIVYREMLNQSAVTFKAHQLYEIESQKYFNLLLKYIQLELSPPVN